jgi:ribosomal protein L11 methyltransferase
MFEKTYQLTLQLKPTHDEDVLLLRQGLRDWLSENGAPEFVEAECSDLWLDPDDSPVDTGHRLEERIRDGILANPEAFPFTLYRYDVNELVRLKEKVEHDFADSIESSISELSTQVWQEGWKDSFKPIETEKFYVYPPWDKPEDLKGKHPVMIDPGMAFGTGQHETTKLCLQVLESLTGDFNSLTSLDVGTGSGILAIALERLGFKKILGTDIDTDAVMCAAANSKDNNLCHAKFEVGSFPAPVDVPPKGYDLIVANILAPVLTTMAPTLKRLLSENALGLIVSGILVEQAEDFKEVCLGLDMTCVLQLNLNDWTCMRFVNTKPLHLGAES